MLDNETLNTVADLAEAMASQPKPAQKSGLLAQIDRGPRVALVPYPEDLAAWQAAHQATEPATQPDTQQETPAPPIAPVAPGVPSEGKQPESPESSESESSESSLESSSAVPSIDSSDSSGRDSSDDSGDSSQVPTNSPTDAEESGSETADRVTDQTLETLDVADPGEDQDSGPDAQTSSLSGKRSAEEPQETDEPIAPSWARLQLHLPPDHAAGGLSWAEVWQQLMHHLYSGDRPWQPDATVVLVAPDRRLALRQIRAIAETLQESQLCLVEIATNQMNTAIAAVTGGWRLTYEPQAASRQDTQEPLDEIAAIDRDPAAIDDPIDPAKNHAQDPENTATDLDDDDPARSASVDGLSSHDLGSDRSLDPMVVDPIELPADRLASQALAEAIALADETDCLYLDHPVRSGVEIRYPGSVIVRGDVNPGGSILAGGDVLVWGRLRGLAHAGVNGNLRAIVMALQLDASQVRIANRAARVPEADFSTPIPEVAYITTKGIRISSATDFAKVEFQERIAIG